MSVSVIAGTLQKEIDAWTARNGNLNIWFRDDDAVKPSTELDELLSRYNAYDTPILIATIPDQSTKALADQLIAEPLAIPCIHGFAHQNHALEGIKKTELIENGADRNTDAVLDELLSGIKKLRTMYGRHLAPILVPPWNRISKTVAARLHELPLKAISGFGYDPLPGELVQMHTQVDIMNWKGGRIGHTPEETSEQFLTVLKDAETRSKNTIGVLSHHLVHDDSAWASIEVLLRTARATKNVKVCNPLALLKAGIKATT